MQIRNVNLTNFRNIKASQLTLGAGLNIFFGDNAQGKTNFLESLYFCATARSHRSHRDRELVMLGEKFCNVSLNVFDGYFENTISFQIEKEFKKMYLNGLPIRKLGELFGNLMVVIFSPEDLGLVKAGPGIRRRFMDMELCQLYPAYYHNLRMYYKVMKQRNNLLRDIAANPKLAESLDVWDEQLVEYGCALSLARNKFVEELDEIAKTNQREITGGKEELEISYKQNVENELFLERLLKGRAYDILRKSTSVGPHKDDMEFRINNKCARLYASQGQQRTAALSIKLAQIDLIESKRNVSPVLLLDDLLSELDSSRQKYLLEKTHGLQSIITLTGAEGAFESYINHTDAKIFEVRNGEFHEKQ